MKRNLCLTIATILILTYFPVVAQPLNGKYGASPKWGSGWMDFTPPINIESSTCLRIEVGGTASKVLIRLLPHGEDAGQPVGIMGGIHAVPSSRILMARITNKHPNISQISIHGNPKAWQFNLGINNGPATLESIEEVPCDNAIYQ
jgi:hypothetical protein